MGFKARTSTPASSTLAFDPSLFGFLIELSQHNDRDWFHEHRDFYESAVKAPLLAFIDGFAPRLGEISSNFRADHRAMFRIHRDVRFSKDKSPYKTHAAAHFRHNVGKDVHAPGFYLHIEPGSVFAGGGIWQPDAAALALIRKRIVEKPQEWQSILAAPDFVERCVLHGNSLVRPPKGFDPEHPLIEDLKRKDYVALVELDDSDVLAADFVERFAEACQVVAPFNRFICGALGVPF